MMKMLIALTVALVLITACQKKETVQSGPKTKKIKIATTLFPLYDFVRTIAGDRADVSLLLPPGMEAHDFNPKPSDIISLKNSDLLIYTNEYMETWLKDILPILTENHNTVLNSCQGINLAEEGEHGHEAEEHEHHEAERDHEKHEAEHDADQEHHHNHGGIDPHTWLDFELAATMIDNIAASISAKDSTNTALYKHRADSLKQKIVELDSRFAEMIKNSRLKKIVYGGHNAFSRFSQHYGIEFLSPFKGFSPAAEPTPKEISELIKTITKDQIKYVFYEEILSPKTAQIISGQTKTELLKLHGVHNLTADEITRGETYLSLMEFNFKQLEMGLK